MSDITTRLRDHSEGREYGFLREQAADEIERLREYLAQGAEIVAQRDAEINRLRAEALEWSGAAATEASQRRHIRAATIEECLQICSDYTGHDGFSIADAITDRIRALKEQK